MIGVYLETVYAGRDSQLLYLLHYQHPDAMALNGLAHGQSVLHYVGLL